MKRQRNYQAIRNSVKEIVSLLLKNKSYCHVLPFWERLHHHESSKTFIAYHLWKGRLQWCRTVCTILVSLASSPSASDQSSLFIHRRVLARTRSSLHDRVIQLPQEFYTVSPVAEIRFIWFSRPFCLFSIIPHKNQKLWLFFFCLTTDWWIAPKRTGPRTHCYRGTCRDLTSWFNYWLALNLWKNDIFVIVSRFSV